MRGAEEADLALLLLPRVFVVALVAERAEVARFVDLSPEAHDDRVDALAGARVDLDRLQGRGARGCLPRRLEGICSGEGPDDKCSDAAHRRRVFFSPLRSPA